MQLGIMQPYFFPYLGHFSLIKHTDRWIVFDTPQFIRQGWIDRNRILKPGGGWQYIKVPLEKKPRCTPIKEMEIRVNEPWQNNILGQLKYYEGKAPYFKTVYTLVESGLEYSGASITELNVRLLKIVCDYLGIRFTWEILSRMNLTLGQINEPDDWPLEICKAVKAGTYYNPPGGMEFYHREKFEKAGINLKFLKVNLLPYRQTGETFEAGLSVIDVMMFNPVARINEFLDNYELL